MTDRSKLLALAEAVEKLTGPDREVDVQIGATQGMRVVDEGHPIGCCCYDKAGQSVMVPRYTASLDAAMTLVPKVWAIDRISSWPSSPEGADNVSGPQAHASMVGTSLDRFGKRMIWGHGGKDGKAEADAVSAALALTAAALRAQAEALS